MPLVLIALFLKGCAENGPVYRPTAAENAGVQDRCAPRGGCGRSQRQDHPHRLGGRCRHVPAEKNASGQHCVLTQTTKTSPGFLLILQEHRERFFCYFSAGSRCFSVNGTRGFHYASLRCGRGRRSRLCRRGTAAHCTTGRTAATTARFVRG